jgi:hypothetical protein
MSILRLVLDVMQKEMKHPSPVWKNSSMTAKEWREIQEEAETPNEFDREERRKSIFQRWKRQELQSVTKECEHGKITVVLDEGLFPEEIPWEAWGRILRLYAPGPFRVYVLGHSSLRTFPSSPADPIQPEHINGGYTYPCKKNRIIIYRAEDATRVLLHELMHASCLDDLSQSTDHQEAETEAWAELLYHALISKGNPFLFGRLQQMQSTWMMLQNQKVKKHLSHPTAFPWRYTIAKEEVWRRWGIFNPLSSSSASSFASASLLSPRTSLRLTIPPSKILCALWKVSPSSIFL